MKRVGYWISEKKAKHSKMFEGFEELCRKEGIEVVRLDLEKPLEPQGPFDLLFHKLNDELAKGEQGDDLAMNHVHVFQRYCSKHPHIPVLDSLTAIHTLLDRNQQYKFVKDNCQTRDGQNDWFIPDFVEILQPDLERMRQLLTANNVRYPIVAKPSVAQGVSCSHLMSLIFNDAGLKDIKVPCVAQSFINHNAVMYKIFVIGSQHYIVERPSIKNLYASEKSSTIFFDSHNVSKPDSASFLNQCDPSDLELPMLEPDERQLEHLAVQIQQKLGLTLFGIDIIIENGTGRYAVIDINSFPGYDGVPDVVMALCKLLKDEMQASEERTRAALAVHAKAVCPANGSCHECLQYSSDDSPLYGLSSGEELGSGSDDAQHSHKKKKKIHMQRITFVNENGSAADEGVTKSFTEFAIDGDGDMQVTSHTDVEDVNGDTRTKARGTDKKHC